MALVLSLVAAGCASGGGEVDSDPASLAEQERLEELYWARVQENRERFTEADARFMRRMIPHHAQALAMVRIARQSTDNPTLLRLASRIENSQQDEIRLMEGWLIDRGEEPPAWELEQTRLVRPQHESMREEMGHGTMPGMLSPEQMMRLREAEGAMFDRLFLEYMIEHHRGAVTMVRELLASDGAAQDPEVFRLASDIQVDQTTEIARMQQMLAALER